MESYDFQSKQCHIVRLCIRKNKEDKKEEKADEEEKEEMKLERRYELRILEELEAGLGGV